MGDVGFGSGLAAMTAYLSRCERRDVFAGRCMCLEF
jgi:hypothetical protein